MNSPDPRKALEALASEHGLPILRYLRDHPWALASQVSEALGIHTTTASRHLVAFHEAGFLERRDHPAKRPTFAYRLKSPVVRLELDLGESVESNDAVALASALIGGLLESLERIGGARLAASFVAGAFGGGDWRSGLANRLTSATDSRAAVLSLIEDARRTLTDLVGAATATRLLRMATERAAEGRGDIVEAMGLPEATP